MWTDHIMAVLNKVIIVLDQIGASLNEICQNATK